MDATIETNICIECRGLGRITYWFGEYNATYGVTYDCPNCDGRGYIREAPPAAEPPFARYCRESGLADEGEA